MSTPVNIPRIIIDINSGCNTCGKSLVKVPSFGGCNCPTVQVPCSTAAANSPCADCETICPDVIEAECVLYTAADIPQLSIKTNDKLVKIIITLAAEIISLKQRVLILEN